MRGRESGGEWGWLVWSWGDGAVEMFIGHRFGVRGSGKIAGFVGGPRKGSPQRAQRGTEERQNPFFVD